MSPKLTKSPHSSPKTKSPLTSPKTLIKSEPIQDKGSPDNGSVRTACTDANSGGVSGSPAQDHDMEIASEKTSKEHEVLSISSDEEESIPVCRLR